MSYVPGLGFSFPEFLTNFIHYGIVDKIGEINRHRMLYAIRHEQEGRDMMIIREVEYAIRILNELNQESPLSASELSKRQEIPSPFIYRVLKKLEAADILSIKRGAKGGYAIKADCSRLTLYDVVSAFENTFLVIECMKAGYECSRNKGTGCCFHKEFGHLQGLLKKELQRHSLAALFAE